MSKEPSRLLLELTASRRLIAELEKYMHNHLNDKDFKPVLKAYNEVMKVPRK